jgi:hypothetical protein
MAQPPPWLEGRAPCPPVWRLLLHTARSAPPETTELAGPRHGHYGNAVAPIITVWVVATCSAGLIWCGLVTDSASIHEGHVRGNIMRIHIAALMLCLVTAIAVATPVHAQTQVVPVDAVQYQPGLNMIGGPPDTDFSPALALFAYGSGGYVTPPSKVAAFCAGYWAYFQTQVTITLAPAPTTSSVSCALQAGYNLVSNPFHQDVTLPSGTTAFYWDPTRLAYSAVTAIPVGGAAWVYAPTAEVLVLSIPATVTISELTEPGPYTAHVGDTVQLLLPSATPYSATADPSFLHLFGAGVTGPLSCTGDPSCALSLVNSFWRWQALRPGTTSISATPNCLRSAPPCTLPSQTFVVDILP